MIQLKIRSREAAGRWLAIATLAASLGLLASSPLSSAQSTNPATAPATQPVPPPGDQQPSPPASGNDDAKRQATLDRLAEVAALNIARTHGDGFWRQQVALQADFELTTPGEPALEGTMMMETKRDRVRVTFKNGTTLLYDGQSAYMWPNTPPLPHALFHVRVLPLLLTAPLKLHDPLMKATNFQRRNLQGKLFGSYRLTPSPEADSPFNSAMVYVEPKAIRMEALAFEPKEALPVKEESPRQVVAVFSDFHTLDNVLLPKSWSIWKWDVEFGAQGEKLIEVKIDNLSHVAPPEDAFIPPSSAQKLIAAPPVSE